MHLFDSYENCDIHIQDCEEHKLQTQPGCNEEETLEVCAMQFYFREGWHTVHAKNTSLAV